MEIFKKGEFKLLWPFYLEYFIASVLFIAPAFYTIYFLNLGFSVFQIGLIIAASGLATLIFEVPTGAVADLYGRRFSVLLGYFLEGICMISLFFIKDFYAILLIFGLWGFGMTFSSGSKDAWIVDSVNKTDKKIIHSFFSKQQFIINSGSILAGLIGALVVKVLGIRTIWLFTALAYLMSILLLYLFTKEDYKAKKIKMSESIHNIAAQTKSSFSYSYKHPVLLYFFIAGIIFVFASGLQANLSWVPLLQELGMKDYYFGYLWSAMCLTIAISPIFSLKFFKKGKERNFIITAIALGAIISLLILFAYNLIFALAILFLSLFFYHSKNPVQGAYFHKFIPSKLRATIGSIKGMITSFAYILALPLAGFLVDKIGARTTIVISAILAIPVIILYLKIKEK